MSQPKIKRQNCATTNDLGHEDEITKVSLRAFHESVDVSEIAKNFGGGGHKKAAGFTLPKEKHIEELFDDAEPEV